MEHYSIGHGHLVVFKYEGDSIFHVMIFDKSTSEIDYPLSIGKSDVPNPEGAFVSQKEGNVMEIEDSEGFTPCSCPSSNGSPQEFAGPRPVAALELASEFESDHPFFKVVLSPTYVDKYMTVPREFFRKHLRKSKQIVTLKCSDRLWQVRLKSNKPRGTAVLSTGWSSFARETGLHTRDVCVFELTDRNNIVFRVSIFSSDGRINMEQSQCLVEGSLEPAFCSSCPSPINAHEKASQFESEYPFFYVVLLPIHIKKNYVIVPWEFIKTYVQEGQPMVTLVYLGRSWEVKLRAYLHSHIASLGAGWSAFARAARLRGGDVCMFELVKRDNTVFRVSIFRSADKEVICID
ncbi:hypothetical protein BT93_H2215 [Corymbia citriodora subsp. variegata]|nr:hypothetical protein BT93_H2215 [Corymbia citriodora subsp. variegata]